MVMNISHCKQLGVLPSDDSLPIGGIDGARKFIDPRLPANTLITGRKRETS